MGRPSKTYPLYFHVYFECMLWCIATPSHYLLPLLLLEDDLDDDLDDPEDLKLLPDLELLKLLLGALLVVDLVVLDPVDLLLDDLVDLLGEALLVDVPVLVALLVLGAVVLVVALEVLFPFL